MSESSEQDDLDLAAVLAEHTGGHECVGGFRRRYAPGECLPYRLARLALDLQGKVELICAEPSPFLNRSVCVRAPGHEGFHVSSALVEDRARADDYRRAGGDPVSV